jgi:hypothetical protein
VMSTILCPCTPRVSAISRWETCSSIAAKGVSWWDQRLVDGIVLARQWDATRLCEFSQSFSTQGIDAAYPRYLPYLGKMRFKIIHLVVPELGLVAETRQEGDLPSALIDSIMLYDFVCSFSGAMEGDCGQPMADHPLWETSAR